MAIKMAIKNFTGPKSIIIYTALLLTVFIFSSVAYSVQLPGQLQSGSVLNSQKNKKNKLLKKTLPFPIIKKAQPEKPGSIPNGKSFLVKGFKFEGNSVIKTFALMRLVSKFENKNLYLKDIYKITDIISDYYHKQGYFLAKAYLPPQQVKNGIVIIKIIEGHLEKIKVEGEKFYKPGFIRDNINATNKGVIRYSALLKSLYLLNEYHDLSVRALLVKGSEPGTTDIIAKVKDTDPFHAYVDYDNFGSRYISANSAGVGIEKGNIISDGDYFTVQYDLGFPFKTSQYYDINYSTPLGDYGTKLDVSYLYSNFMATGQYGSLGIKGRAEMWNADVTYPILRTRRSSLNFIAGFSRESLYNYILDTISSHDEIRPLSVGFAGNYADVLGNTFFSANLTHGITGIFGGSKNGNPYASYFGAEYNFYVLNLNAERVQRFFWNTFFLLKASAQLSDVTLPVAQKMSIGGEGSVRGYPVSQDMGDSGYTGSIEYRIPPPFISGLAIKNRKIGSMVQLLGFVDYGRVFSRDVLSGGAPNSQLAGTGGGIRLNLPGGLKAAFDIGFPIGTNRPYDSSSYMTYFSLEEKFF